MFLLSIRPVSLWSEGIEVYIRLSTDIRIEKEKEKFDNNNN